MKGKILGAGAISGEDGVRYYYEEKELKNLKEGQKFEGCEVDFDIKDGKAVGVYIVKGGGFNADFGKVGANVSASLKNANLPSFDSKFVFWDLNEAKANLIGANMHSVKFWFLVAILFNAVSILVLMTNKLNADTAWFWIGFVSFAFILWSSFCLGKPSGSYKPFMQQILVLVLGIVLLFLLRATLQDYYYLRSDTPYVKIVFSTLFTLIALFISFLWFKTLASITNEKVFLLSFIVGVACLVFFSIDIDQTIKTWQDSWAFYVGWICYAGFFGLFAYATLKFREIRQIAL